MQLQRFKTPGLAHLAYLLSSGQDALLVDPRRDIAPYLTALRQEGLRLRYVLLTHKQEDFVLGARIAARLTGATIVGGLHPFWSYAGLRLDEGEVLELGALRLVALPTPGHTPESMSYAIHLGGSSEPAFGVFTGDALFFGDTGRTDLEDPSRTGENAGRLYDALHRRILPLGDQALVLPAHGAGSVCGSHIADRPLSTLGLERTSNPAFTMAREDFSRHKESERLPRPPYFSRVGEANRTGGAEDLPELGSVQMLSPGDFQRVRADGGIIIDTREPEAFAGGHLQGAYSVWLGGLATFGGWVTVDGGPVYLVLERDGDLDEAANALFRIGVDRVEGALSGGIGAWRKVGLPLERSGTLTPGELFEGEGHYQVLDVRDISEFEGGHLPGALHCYVGHLEERLDELPLSRELPVGVICSIGHRSGLAVSILLRHGFSQVANVLGGMTARKKLDLPTEQGSPRREPLEADASPVA